MSVTVLQLIYDSDYDSQANPSWTYDLWYWTDDKIYKFFMMKIPYNNTTQLAAITCPVWNVKHMKKVSKIVLYILKSIIISKWTSYLS